MANASVKRVAQQNDKAIQTLKLATIIPTILSFLFRIMLGRTSPSKSAIFIYVVTFCPAFFLSNYLVKIGTSRRDPAGTLISYGEDLNQPGVTEWCFDILYVTWFCQIGSGLFGEWFWWFYLVIPLYAVVKLTSFVWPMLFGGPSAHKAEAGAPVETTSKRQEKLRKRGEKGDPRVQTQRVRK